MKTYQPIFLFIAIALTLTGCAEKKQVIVDPKQYEVYLTTTDKSLVECQTGMEFWKARLIKSVDDETSQLKLASLYASRFKLNGKIEDIYTSDSLYQQVLKNYPQGHVGIYQSLATNCITKHEFRQAKNYVERALAIGDSKPASLFMMVDINLELGDYAGAKTVLKDFTNKNSFAYLIREAKVKDHEGKLDTAIFLMEKALDRIKENKSLFTWTKSNLGDMYGHAGRVEEAYQAYLDVLKTDPEYDYALKGIAWIAFSHDHNPSEAKRIINFIAGKRSTPDMHLLLAEIAVFEKNESEKISQLKLFESEARDPKYLGMYNKYLATLEAEELSNPAKAIEIAEQEIRNRPTPQSYDLLAWGYYQQGQIEMAVEVAQRHIEGKTFEPEAIYHLGLIYHNLDEEKSQKFLVEASESSFELGPAISANIQQHLNSSLNGTSVFFNQINENANGNKRTNHLK